MGLRTQLCNPSFNIELSARPVQTRLLSKLELACKLVHDGWKLHATDDVLKPHRRKSALVFLESFYDKSKLYLEVLNNVSDVFKKKQESCEQSRIIARIRITRHCFTCADGPPTSADD